MYNSDVVHLRELIEGRVAESRPHQCSTEQNNRITGLFSIVGIGYSIWIDSSSLWIWREHEAAMESYIADEVEYFHGIVGSLFEL
jgi:hypothetical protein